MKHLLIDFDSVIPNLALMKISTWAKAKGDQVYLNDDSIEPDEIWLPCIFTWNAQKAKSALSLYAMRYPSAKIHYGGTGFDFFLPYGSPEWKKLPLDIESTKPDYDLYDDDRIVGFCQRGCDRKCQFCVVWRKEGRISENDFHRLTEWVPPDRNKVLLLDNDIALAERWKHDVVKPLTIPTQVLAKDVRLNGQESAKWVKKILKNEKVIVLKFTKTHPKGQQRLQVMEAIQ